MKTIKFLSLSLVLIATLAFEAKAEKVTQYKNTPDQFFHCFENSDKLADYYVSKEVVAACRQGNQSIQLVRAKDGTLSLLSAFHQVFRREKQSEYENYTAPDHSVVNIIGLDFGAIDSYALSADKKLATSLNLFFDQDPTKWGQSEIFAELNINLADGNVVTIYQKDGNIAYDITVKNGREPKLAFIGGDSKVDANGNLEVVQGDSRLVSLKPECYAGARNADKDLAKNVSNCLYNLSSNGEISFTTEGTLANDYVVDPGLVWLTLFGNSVAFSLPNALEVASDGGVIIAGYAGSGGLPATTPGVYTVANPSDTAFLTKFLADGSGLAFHTLFGGSGSDSVTALAVDPVTQDIIVGGGTPSINFPVTVGAYDTSFNDSGIADIFITRFNSNATSIVFSTFIGGNDGEVVSSVKVTSNGNILFAGETKSSNFPTLNAYQSTRIGTGDAIMGKMAANGASLISSSYLGGTETSGFNYDKAYDIIETIAGDIILIGSTCSSSFPVSPSGVIDSTFNGTSSLSDGFVFKWVGGSGTSRVATFVGGAGRTTLSSVNELSDGSFALIGATFSASFQTTVGAIDTTFSGTNDSIFVRVNAALNSRMYSTLIGGSVSDAPSIPAHIGAVLNDSIIFCANTRSSDLTTTLGAYDTTFAHVPTNPSNHTDSYLAKITPNLSGTYDLQYLTLLGSSVGNEVCNGLVVKPNGNAILTGTTSWVFGNPNNLQATAGAYSNAGPIFVTEVDMLPTGANKYGISSDTSLSGMTPIIDVNSSPTSGNNSFGIQLWGAAPNSYCILGASVFPDVLGTDFYGLKWHLSLAWGLAGILFLPDFALPMLTDAAGNLTLPLSLPLGISGLQVCFQWYCFDPALNLTASNALDVVIQ